MANHHQYAAVLLGLFSSAICLSLEKRQGPFNPNNPNPLPISGIATCPGQQTGQFPYQDDCSKFIQCDNGVATVLSCQPQLIFNPATSYCDYPHMVPNPSCRMITNTILTDSANGLCLNNPHGGNPENAFQVGHPQFCNAFYTCSTGYLYAPCVFCPEDMYFSDLAGACMDARMVDRGQLCGGKTLVPHKDKVYKQLDGSCWPFTNIANPFAPLLAKLEREGYNPATGFVPPFNPNPNPPFNPNAPFNPNPGK